MYSILHTGPPLWVLFSREECKPEEGAPPLSGHHHRWRERLSQPAACLHHQRAAGWLSAQRGLHQKRYSAARQHISISLLREYVINAGHY